MPPPSGRPFSSPTICSMPKATKLAVGKAVAKDAGRGKATLVALLGIEPARARLKALVEDAEAALAPFGGQGGYAQRRRPLRRLAPGLRADTNRGDTELMTKARRRAQRKWPLPLRVVLARPRLLHLDSGRDRVGALLPYYFSELRGVTRLLVGWDIGVALYLVLAFWMIAHSSARPDSPSVFPSGRGRLRHPRRSPSSPRPPASAPSSPGSKRRRAPRPSPPREPCAS